MDRYEVTPTVVADDTSCCGGEAGICYVVNSTAASATVTIDDNDVPELYAVTYELANYITTDPVYNTSFNNGQFANWETGTEITTDHWFDVSVANEAGENDNAYTVDREYPASYVRNTRPSVTAEWMRRPEPGYTMFVRGDGPDAVDAPWEEYTLNGSNSSRALFALYSLPDTIKYYETFQIDWEFSLALAGESTPTGGWADAGSSSTELYVTLDTPEPQPLFHTVVHTGTKAADGKSTETDAIAAIWAEFSDRNVVRRDHTRLTYWRIGWAGPGKPLIHASHLLAYTDGQCSAWTDFFSQTLGAHGIGSTEIKVTSADLAVDPSAGFLVKQWTFNGSGTSGYTDYPYVGTVDVVLDNPADGQGNPSPNTLWKLHFIVMVGTNYYDPSYGGQVHASQAAWEADMLSAFVVERPVNGVMTIVAKPNSAAVETTFTPVQ